MASSGKKRTTMAKLTRETKLRERRVDKAARKHARKQDRADPSPGVGHVPNGAADEEPRSRAADVALIESSD